ncbi:hypothetical protein GLOIN_2v1470303 [Rhizophagus irregularis DAOM 181602=DAOM 197198]|uniref:Hsp70 family protein n=1 Tax=Rhizophagus irregularis (strain DAOM 181602 / DAOM 197198 / MUCL 43194) TaxID=747089 RepID=A0A2P4QWQ1_RHIID|nr:hypothetical protein GLOIN_2v1470303 [Rhizophagus irregularis DAOM 181602=DAOM 197198]POG82032.1 hypothetical protein GLOIN_2v1470303 [Rhizophagus irregularis DAOM 181602=DAOM 197198]|eukprot:XP_025188898.1 hypothetical protein GLOIN_2v1470303 [Rhizophagus irregularis DAOM 181602=DAOM 197198]
MGSIRGLLRLIKKTVTTRWHGIRFFEHVLLVISVESNKIDLQLKPEAAAIYCMQNPNEHNNGIIPINVVGKIIRLIRGQLNSSKDKCSAIFLVGGFGEPKYLQMKEFGKLVPAIIVPKQPIAAIVRGACDYGLKMSTIADRTLKYTYGIKANRHWSYPIDRKITCGNGDQN